MTTLAILQPGFLPWLGFFDQMIRSDVFVLYDDVQFDKHGWRNRNRIKTANGISWLTVPVQHSGRLGQSILETRIDNSRRWARKLVQSVLQAYAGAAHREPYSDEFAKALEEPWDRLVDLDIRLINLMCRWLDVATPIVRTSELAIEGGQSERLVAICRNFGATAYLSGNAAKAYLDVPLFEQSGIKVVWQDYEHPRYRQLHGDFAPFLSALDLVLNMGPESPRILRGIQ